MRPCPFKVRRRPESDQIRPTSPKIHPFVRSGLCYVMVLRLLQNSHGLPSWLRAYARTDHTTPCCAREDGNDEHTNLLDSPRLDAAADARFSVAADTTYRSRRAAAMNRIRGLRRRLRPWHWLAALAGILAVIAAVLAGLLVTSRKAIEANKSVRVTFPSSSSSYSRHHLCHQPLFFVPME